MPGAIFTGACTVSKGSTLSCRLKLSATCADREGRPAVTACGSLSANLKGSEHRDVGAPLIGANLRGNGASNSPLPLVGRGTTPHPNPPPQGGRESQRHSTA